VDEAAPEHPGETEVEEPPEHSLRRAAYLTAAVGIAHALLFLLAFLLMSDTPKPTASDAEIVEYYSSDSSRRVVLVGLYIMPFAGIAFIWFTVALRMWISGSARRINVLLSNMQLVSGILFVALFFGAAGAYSTTAASVEFSDAPIDPAIARQFPQMGASLIFVFAMRMAAMFVITTSNIGRRTGILPRWFALLGIVLGAFLLLSASFSTVLALAFPVWVLMLSVFLIIRARQIPKDVVLPRRGPLPSIMSVVRKRGSA
jgi:hypothetical protein